MNFPLRKSEMIKPWEEKDDVKREMIIYEEDEKISKIDRFKAYVNSTTQEYKFNFFVRLSLELFLEVTLFSLLQFTYSKLSNWLEVISLFISIIIFLLVLGFLLFTLLFPFLLYKQCSSEKSFFFKSF